MKIKKIYILVIIFIALFIPQFIFSQENNEFQETVRGNTAFAIDLYKNLKKQTGNLFFSPYSISVALAMTYVGARGQTEKEIAQVLHFSGQKELRKQFSEIQLKLKSVQKREGVILSIANSLWLQKDQGFLEEFFDINKQYYQAKLELIDFRNIGEARIIINHWIEEETKDKIKELIKPGMLDPVTELILCNAIYFKALWAYPFEKGKTIKAPFYITSEKTVDIEMMKQTEEFCCNDFSDFYVIELPYLNRNNSLYEKYGKEVSPIFNADELANTNRESSSGGQGLSMIIFLPKEIDGLSEFEENFTEENLNQWVKKVVVAPKRRLNLSLPKFKTTSEFQLEDVLSIMGMPSAFCSKADFSGINGLKNLFIYKLIHKAFVDVNEEGTEASAAATVMFTLGGEKPKDFNVNHPFIFVIRDNCTGSILFIGRIVNPQP